MSKALPIWYHPLATASAFVIVAVLFATGFVAFSNRAEAVTVTQVWYTDFTQCEGGEPGCGVPGWYPRLALTLQAMGEPYTMTKLFDCDCEDHMMALVSVTAERDVLASLQNATHSRIDTDLTDAQTEIRSKPTHAAIRIYMQQVYNRWQAQGCVLPPDPVDLMVQPPIC